MNVGFIWIHRTRNRTSSSVAALFDLQTQTCTPTWRCRHRTGTATSRRLQAALAKAAVRSMALECVPSTTCLTLGDQVSQPLSVRYVTQCHSVTQCHIVVTWPPTDLINTNQSATTPRPTPPQPNPPTLLSSPNGSNRGAARNVYCHKAVSVLLCGASLNMHVWPRCASSDECS